MVFDDEGVREIALKEAQEVAITVGDKAVLLQLFMLSTYAKRKRFLCSAHVFTPSLRTFLRKRPLR